MNKSISCIPSWVAFLALAGVSIMACAQQKTAQFPAGYPSKPVRVLTGNPAGSGADVLLRIVAQSLTERLGRAIIVDNRSGAAGGIAVDLGANAAPDGYTLLACSTANITAMVLKAVNIDIPKAFAPVVLLGSTPFVLVATPSLPAKSVGDLIALAKSKPLVYSSAGTGSTVHLGMELFKFMAGIDMTHVPYKGSGQSVIDLTAGRIHVALVNTLTATPIVRSGKLRALGVTSLQRTQALPEVPTISESGVKGYDLTTWYGLFAPIKTAPAIVEGLNIEVNQGLASPEVKRRLAEGGVELSTTYSSAEFKRLVTNDIDMWTKFVRTSGAKLD